MTLAIAQSAPKLTPVAHLRSSAIPTVTESPLFRSAQEAIRFAVTRTGAPKPPMMSTMIASSPRPAARGLSGLDGAAQAGMIMSVLRQLGELNRAVLVANEAPRHIRCGCKRACCSRRRVNPDWSEAIAEIANAAVAGALCNAPYRLRAAIVASIYSGAKLAYWEIARDTESTVDVIGKHYRPIYRWLYGTKAGYNTPAIPGVDPQAWRQAEAALINSGIVGVE